MIDKLGARTLRASHPGLPGKRRHVGEVGPGAHSTYLDCSSHAIVLFSAIVKLLIRQIPCLRERQLINPHRHQRPYARPVLSISLITRRTDIDRSKQFRLTNISLTSFEKSQCLLGGVWEPRFDDGLAVYTHRLTSLEEQLSLSRLRGGGFQVPFLIEVFVDWCSRRQAGVLNIGNPNGSISRLEAAW